MLRALPNALTLSNLILGCSAIAAVYDNKLMIALVLAAICLVFDVADGLLARRLNVSSELGEQLDSLADLVSFGVLPAFMLFSFLRDDCPLPGAPWLAYGAFIFAGAVALRLARFNLDDRERSVFYGLPSPSAATAVFGMTMMKATDHPFWPAFCHPAVIYGVVLLLTLLMLTNLRLWSLKGVSKPRGKLILTGLLIMALVAILCTGTAGVTLTVGLYVVISLLNVVFKIY